MPTLRTRAGPRGFSPVGKTIEKFVTTGLTTSPPRQQRMIRLIGTVGAGT
jgi:hypothetical protein